MIPLFRLLQAVAAQSDPLLREIALAVAAAALYELVHWYIVIVIFLLLLVCWHNRHRHNRP